MISVPTRKMRLGIEPHIFEELGSLESLSNAMGRGMVLAMSVWDDQILDSNMNWLDSNYPTDQDPVTPGVLRGPCLTDSGIPSDVESSAGNSNVIFSNIKYGPLGSTYPQPAPVAHYGQCGGPG
jgi:cellulose 1,4-beta-cellobiosidase